MADYETALVNAIKCIHMLIEDNRKLRESHMPADNGNCRIEINQSKLHDILSDVLNSRTQYTIQHLSKYLSDRASDFITIVGR